MLASLNSVDKLLNLPHVIGQWAVVSIFWLIWLYFVAKPL